MGGAWGGHEGGTHLHGESEEGLLACAHAACVLHRERDVDLAEGLREGALEAALG